MKSKTSKVQVNVSLERGEDEWARAHAATLTKQSGIKVSRSGLMRKAFLEYQERNKNRVKVVS